MVPLHSCIYLSGYIHAMYPIARWHRVARSTINVDMIGGHLRDASLHCGARPQPSCILGRALLGRWSTQGWGIFLKRNLTTALATQQLFPYVSPEMEGYVGDGLQTRFKHL